MSELFVTCPKCGLATCAERPGVRRPSEKVQTPCTRVNVQLSCDGFAQNKVTLRYYPLTSCIDDRDATDA